MGKQWYDNFSHDMKINAEIKKTAAQRELLECRIRRFGNGHAETLAARARLCDMLMGKVGA